MRRTGGMSHAASKASNLDALGSTKQGFSSQLQLGEVEQPSPSDSRSDLIKAGTVEEQPSTGPESGASAPAAQQQLFSQEMASLGAIAVHQRHQQQEQEHQQQAQHHSPKVRCGSQSMHYAWLCALHGLAYVGVKSLCNFKSVYKLVIAGTAAIPVSFRLSLTTMLMIVLPCLCRAGAAAATGKTTTQRSKPEGIRPG